MRVCLAESLSSDAMTSWRYAHRPFTNCNGPADRQLISHDGEPCSLPASTPTAATPTTLPPCPVLHRFARACRRGSSTSLPRNRPLAKPQRPGCPASGHPTKPSRPRPPGTNIPDRDRGPSDEQPPRRGDPQWLVPLPPPAVATPEPAVLEPGEQPPAAVPNPAHRLFVEPPPPALGHHRHVLKPRPLKLPRGHHARRGRKRA